MATAVRNSSKSARAPRAKVVPLHRTADTRERVLVVALNLFAERGYRGTSLRDIAKRIGIKAPSLLHHFPSKQQLYLAVLDSIFEGMEDGARSVLSGPGDLRERAKVAVVGAIDYIARSPEAMRLIYREMSDESGVGRQLLKRRVPPLHAVAINFVFRGQREGLFRNEIDPFSFVQSMTSISLGYFMTASVTKRLWNTDMLEATMIARRKQQVLDLVERTLFVSSAGRQPDVAPAQPGDPTDKPGGD